VKLTKQQKTFAEYNAIFVLRLFKSLEQYGRNCPFTFEYTTFTNEPQTARMEIKVSNK